MSCQISGCEKSSGTDVKPEAMAVANAVWTSVMDETGLLHTLMSQAPLSRDRQRGILEPGVLGAMPPRKRRSLDWARQRPAMLWRWRSNF